MNTNYSRDNMSEPSIVAFAQGDVTGDRVTDQCLFNWNKDPDSPFTQNITLHVKDGRTGVLTSIPLRENVGYNPSLFLGDFTGNGVADILISIATGGSGGIMYHYVVSFVG